MLTALGPLAMHPAVLAMHPGWHAAFWPFFLLIPLLWIAVIVAIFIVVGRRRMHWHSPAHLAEQTLAERFARGDIDEVEYRARLEVLRANRGR